MNAAWLTAFTALAAAVGGMAVWAGRWAVRVLMRTTRFLDDWAGVADRPGVMARLRELETGLARVLAETQPDHGHSLRDVLHKVREDVSDVKNDQAAMRARIEQFETQRETRERDDHA